MGTKAKNRGWVLISLGIAACVTAILQVVFQLLDLAPFNLIFLLGIVLVLAGVHRRIRARP